MREYLKRFDRDYVSAIEKATASINHKFETNLYTEIQDNLVELSKMTGVTGILMGMGDWVFTGDLKVEVDDTVSPEGPPYMVNVCDITNLRCGYRDYLTNPKILIPLDNLTHLLDYLTETSHAICKRDFSIN